MRRHLAMQRPAPLPLNGAAIEVIPDPSCRSRNRSSRHQQLPPSCLDGDQHEKSQIALTAANNWWHQVLLLLLDRCLELLIDRDR